MSRVSSALDRSSRALRSTPVLGAALDGSTRSLRALRTEEMVTKAKTVVRPTFEELKAIEKLRREMLRRTELPPWRIFFYWSGTCLRDIKSEPLLWFTLAIYIGIRVAAHVIDYTPVTVTFMQGMNIAIVSGFLSFFLVIFVNQTNSRFLEMYGFCKATSGRIQDVAGLARVQLPTDMGERLVKHFIAALIAGYVGLNAIGMGSPYSKEHFFDVYNTQHRLLTPEEMAMLDHHDMDNSGLCMKELVTWVQEDVVTAYRAEHLDTYQALYMHEKILDFRAAMDGMYDYSDQPPHFFYIHFLVFLSALYLPLFAIETAYGSGWGEEAYTWLDVLNGIIVFLQCIFVIGLRSLGTKMIDPYGRDSEDLSVIMYVEDTLAICNTIMKSKQPDVIQMIQKGAPEIQKGTSVSPTGIPDLY